MAIPPELRNLVLLDLSYSDLINYFEGTNDPVRHDETFWKDKAVKDLNISSHEFFHPNPVEAMIPAVGHQRYLQIVSRTTLVRGSEQFVTIAECLYRTIKNRNDDLAEYFMGLPLIYKDNGEVYEHIQAAIIYAALEINSKDWFERGFELRPETWRFRPIEEPFYRAAGRGSSIALLNPQVFHLDTWGLLIGTVESGRYLNEQGIREGEGYLWKYVALQSPTPEALADLDDQDLGYVLARIGDLELIKRYRAEGNLDITETSMIQILKYALMVGRTDMGEYALNLIDLETRLEIELSSKPTSLLARITEERPNISIDPFNVLPVLEYGFVNPATFKFLRNYHNQKVADQRNVGFWLNVDPHTIYTDGDFE